MLVAWDTETCLIQQGLLAPPLVAVSWAKQVPGGIESGVLHWTEARDHIEGYLKGHSVLMNAPFDLAVVAAQFPDLTHLVFEALDGGRIYDVMTREKLLDIAEDKYEQWDTVDGKQVKRSYSLAAMCKRYLGIELEKGTVQLRYHEVRDIPIDQWPAEFLDYATTDAEVLFGVLAKQEQRRDAFMESHNGVDPLADQYRQFASHFWLHLCSCWGIRTDPERVRKLENHLKVRLKETEEVLQEAGLMRKNGARNTMRAKEILIECLGSRGVKLTPTGNKKVSDEGWTKEQAVEAGYVKVDGESCKESGDARLLAYTEFSHLLKLHGTYVEALWAGTKKPIQPYFNSLRETGRTSCSRPNLQNPPREDGVRQCYVPRPGCVFIGCDYDKAELHALAQLCTDLFQESKLAERLRAGFDPHLDLAAGIRGIDYEEALRRKKGRDPDIKEARQMAKAANFGYPGGLGALSFMAYAKAAYGVVISEDQAKALKNYWLECWPEMRLYFDYISKRCGTAGSFDYVQMRSGRVRGGVKFTVACNTGFQGCAADGAKAAGWEITKRQFTQPSSSLYGTHIVNFVHDEFIIEAREEVAHEAALELSHVMCEEFNKFTPDVPVTAEPAIMRCWEKEAEPVWSNGRLVPWEKQAA